MNALAELTPQATVNMCVGNTIKHNRTPGPEKDGIGSLMRVLVFGIVSPYLTPVAHLNSPFLTRCCYIRRQETYLSRIYYKISDTGLGHEGESVMGRLCADSVVSPSNTAILSAFDASMPDLFYLCVSLTPSGAQMDGLGSLPVAPI